MSCLRGVSVACAALVLSQLSAQAAQRIEPRPDFVIERELAPGATDRHDLPLTAGQFAELVVTGAGGAAVSLVDPGGTERVRTSRETTPDGARRLREVAEQTGTYGVVVAASRTGARVRYRLVVTMVRQATDIDRARTAATRAFAEGERLTLLRSGAGYRSAITEFQRAAEQWKSTGDRAEEATALFRLGFAYSSASQSLQSIEAYLRSAALRHELGDRRSEGTALNNAASQYYELDDYPMALRYYEQALELRQATGDKNGEAFTLAGLGTVNHATGDVEKALAQHQQATALWQAAGNRAGEATGFHNIGSVSRSLGRFQDALDFFTRALDIRRAIGDAAPIANTLTLLGNLRVTLGHPDEALEAYREALPLRRASGGRRGEARTLNAMGTALAERGEWTAALDHFSQAGAIFRALGDPDGEGHALLSTGRTWLKRDDPRRALEALERSYALYEAIGARRSMASVHVALGEAYARLGAPDFGLEHYRTALSVFHCTRDRNAELTALLGLAALEQRLDRLADARGHAEEAVRLLESLRSGVASEELRSSYLAVRHEAYPLYIDLEMQLEAREPGRGHLERALAGSERARARGLVDLLAEVQIGSGSPQYASLTQPMGLTAGDFQRLLDKDTLLLEYSLGAERSYLWAVTRDAVKGFVLPPRARVEAAARRAYGLLARGARRETQRQTARALESLAAVILSPVPATLWRSRLVVVADGALQYVPFAALPAPGRDEPLIAGHQVVTLPSASTLDALRRTARGAERSPVPSVVEGPHELAVFADPVLRQADPRLVKKPDAGAETGSAAEAAALRSARESGFASLDRLPFARAEARAITALTPPARTLEALDFDASRDAALAELGRYRLVHFATHALLNSQHPERSGILLSMVDRDGTPIDGFLRLQDVYNLRLSADLVVLSACRTALGKDVRGEGLVGMTRGFLYAGAPAVIASLWDVRDRSTAELMTRLYRAMLRDRLTPAAALRAAQTSMWRDPRWSAPAHWAGFTLQGDWQQRK